MDLTDADVEAAAFPPGQKDKLYFEDRLPGFALRVNDPSA
jgi:hypothetical protein